MQCWTGEFLVASMLMSSHLSLCINLVILDVYFVCKLRNKKPYDGMQRLLNSTENFTVCSRTAKWKITANRILKIKDKCATSISLPKKNVFLTCMKTRIHYVSCTTYNCRHFMLPPFAGLPKSAEQKGKEKRNCITSSMLCQSLSFKRMRKS